MSETVTEFHAFHYLTHSVVWHIITQTRPGCFAHGEHVHTPDGLDAHVFCSAFLTRAGAQRSIAEAVADHERCADVLGPVTVFCHRDEAPHAG